MADWNIGNEETIIVQAELVGAREFQAEANANAASLTRMGEAADVAGVSMERSSKRSWLLSQGMFTLRRAVYAGTLALAALGAGAVYAGIKFDNSMEQNTIALAHFLGSTTAAHKELKSLYLLAAYTPFQFADVTTAAKSFLSFGFTVDQTNRYLKILADTASGLGESGQQVQQFTNDIVKMAARGKIMGQDIRELVSLHIPALKILQEQLGLTQLQLQNIGNANIPSQVAIDALFKGLQQRYGGLAAVLQKTAQGQISTLKDLGSLTLGTIMMPLYNWIKGKLLPGINEILKQLYLAFGPGGGGLMEALHRIENDKKIPAWFKTFFSLLVAITNFVKGPALHTFEGLGLVLFIIVDELAKLLIPVLNFFTKLDAQPGGKWLFQLLGIILAIIAAEKIWIALTATQLVGSLLSVGRLAIWGAIQLGEYLLALLGVGVLQGEVVVESTALTIAYGEQAVATEALTVAQTELDAAMWANPIGLIVLGVIALVAALVLLYMKSGTFRQIVNGAFESVVSVATILWHVIEYIVQKLEDAYGIAKDIVHIASEINPANWSGSIDIGPGGGGIAGAQSGRGNPFARGSDVSVGALSTPHGKKKTVDAVSHDGIANMFTSHTTLVVDRKVLGESVARYEQDVKARQ